MRRGKRQVEIPLGIRLGKKWERGATPALVGVPSSKHRASYAWADQSLALGGRVQWPAC